MRHGKKFNHLGRKTPHRKAMLANMASSLIKHKRIVTTVAKAKALRVYVEPLITKGKDATTHNQRTVFAYLKDKEAVHELFTVVGGAVANRPGGYTRILKTGNRAGDNAEMAFIELVDFNELFTGFGDNKKGGAKKTRRGRKGTGTEVVAETTTAKAPKAPKAEKVAAVAETEVAQLDETAVQEIATPEIATQVAAEEVAVEEVAVEEVAVEEVATEEVAVEEVATEEASVEEVALESAAEEPTAEVETPVAEVETPTAEVETAEETQPEETEALDANATDTDAPDDLADGEEKIEEK